MANDQRNLKNPHSIQFSGGARYSSSKSPGGEDLEIQEPVVCRYASAFHFHTALTRMLGSTLIRDQVVEVRYPSEKRVLAAPDDETLSS